MGISLHDLSLTKPSLVIVPSYLYRHKQRYPLSLSLPNRTANHISIECSRNSQRPNRKPHIKKKFLLKAVYFLATNLNILPKPLESAIREFGGGNGGGIGFLKGFGGGGFDGWRRRKRKFKLGLFAFVMACGLGMWLVLGNELNSNVILGVVGMSLLGASVNGYGRGLKDYYYYILGFCFSAVLVGVGIKRESLLRCPKGIRVIEIVTRRKKRGSR